MTTIKNDILLGDWARASEQRSERRKRRKKEREGGEEMGKYKQTE